MLFKQYYATESLSEKGKLFKALHDVYLKPYSAEKEDILLNDMNRFYGEHEFQKYILLKTIYASIQSIKGLHQKSKTICNELLGLDKKYLDQFLNTKILLIQGLSETKQINFKEANQKFIEARDLAIKNKDIENHVGAEFALLTGFLLVRQPDKALAELERIQTLYPEHHDDNFQMMYYRVKGTCYLLKSLKDKQFVKDMFSNLDKSEELALKLNDYTTLFACNFSKGIYYSGEERNEQRSNIFLLKAIEAGEKLGCKREIYLSYNYLIQNNIRSNNLDSAEAYAKRSISATSGEDFEELRVEKYYSLAGIYLKKHDDKKVLEMMDSVRSTLITSYNKRFDKTYAELQTKYETSEKEKKIAILDKDNELNKLIIETQRSSLKQKDLEEENRRNQIALLNSDKMLLSTNNELLFKQNELKEISILNSDMSLKRQKVEQEKQRIELEKLQAKQQYEKLRSVFVYSILGVLVITLSLFFTWLRTKQKQKNELEKQRYEVDLLESKLATYSAQMNPHFMFNSMNAVNNYILKNDTHEASYYLTKYSKLMRQVLENSTHKLISMQDELDTLKLYIEMEQLRFGNKFSYQFNFDENLSLDEILIPPLILQPFVENAINHGFMHKTTNGHLIIAIKDCNDHFLCSIDDDGVGRDYTKNLATLKVKEHRSMGLEITASRLKIFNKNVSEKEIVNYIDKKDAQGNSLGTRVEIYLPDLA